MADDDPVGAALGRDRCGRGRDDALAGGTGTSGGRGRDDALAGGTGTSGGQGGDDAADATRTGILLGCMTIPGKPESVRAAREFVADKLGDRCPLADTAILLTSEVVTNSAVHSDSRRDGGTITITLIAVPGGIRAEIIDDGGATVPSVLRNPQLSLLTEGGLGLQLVDTLSDRWDYWQDEAGTVTWFELSAPPQ
jgi:anti-sigma regulatory factor (Ser/Thr protein kinase)